MNRIRYIRKLNCVIQEGLVKLVSIICIHVRMFAHGVSDGLTVLWVILVPIICAIYIILYHLLVFIVRAAA